MAVCLAVLTAGTWPTAGKVVNYAALIGNCYGRGWTAPDSLCAGLKLRGGHDDAEASALQEGPSAQQSVLPLRAMLEEAAAEVEYDLAPLPAHFGTPKSAQDAASVGAPDAVPPPPACGSNVCDKDWPIDPVSGKRRFGKWFYQEPAGMEDPGPPVVIPNAADAHLIDPRDFEDEEPSVEALNERLLYAALTGQDEWIERLVQMGAQINAARDVPFGNATALHCCAVGADVAVARALLSQGADVGLLNAFRQSPLHLAAYHGNTDVLKVLYRRGALHPSAASSGRRRGSGAKVAQHDHARKLLQLKDAYGYSALDYAESENRSEAANMIRQELEMDPIDPTILALQKEAELAAAARIKSATEKLKVAFEEMYAEEMNAARQSEEGCERSGASDNATGVSSAGRQDMDHHDESAAGLSSPQGEPSGEIANAEADAECARMEEMLHTLNMSHPIESLDKVLDLSILSSVGEDAANRLWYGSGRRPRAAGSMMGDSGRMLNSSVSIDDLFQTGTRDTDTEEEIEQPGTRDNDSEDEIEHEILRWAEGAMQASGRGGVKEWVDQFSEHSTFNLNVVRKDAIKVRAPENPYAAADYVAKGVREIEEEAEYFEKHGKLPAPKVRAEVSAMVF